VQEVTEAPLGKSEPVPGGHVEIPDAYGPGGFKSCLGVLVGMLVEFVAEGHAAQSEAEFRPEYLSR
jgi:hypothetical protein